MQLFNLLGKPSGNPEKPSAVMLAYEKQNTKYFTPILNLVSDDEAVGIEIEVENIKKHGCSGYGGWQVHNDGSLRDNGYEYVSVPCSGTRIHFHLNQFFDTMDKDIRFSPRTSIHIHQNALNMTPKQLAGEIITYIPFEILLYRFAGGNRQYSNFCVPLMDVADLKYLMDMFLNKTFEVPHLPNHRYMGLNLDAIRKYGTLEFRHLGGTNDKIKICRWINLILCIKKYAMNHSYEDIIARIHRLNSDSTYMMFFDEVFSTCGWYLDTHSLQKDMELGVSRVKSLTIKNDFKEALKKSTTYSSEWLVRMGQKSKTNTMIFGSPPPRARNRAILNPPPVRREVRRDRDELFRIEENGFAQQANLVQGLAAQLIHGADEIRIPDFEDEAPPPEDWR